MGLFRKVRDTFLPRRVEDRIDDEFQFHLEQRIADLMARGLPAEEAQREAARMFGNRARIVDSTRDRDILTWLQSILQDLRFAVRNLRRSPTFTAVAILSLAFGIGVNAAIFTLVDGILLDKLQVPDPQRIVQVHVRLQGFENDGFNIPIFRELQRQQDIFTDLIGFHSNPVLMDLGGDPQHGSVQFVTGGYFRFFRARPALGRLIDDEDDRSEGAHPVCVLSYGAWRNLFGGDPGVLRRSVRIRGIPLQIVGVAPPGFAGAELQSRYDLFVPTSEGNDLAGIPRESSNYIYLRILGRLRPSLTRQGASARLAAASRAIEEALPKEHANGDGTYQLLDASRGFDSWRSQLHDPLLILMGAVSLVLLVACANLANLLLARTAERRQEFAIKLAIGISRWRLMRQLLVETGLLAVAGGACALLAGATLTRILLSMFNAGSEWSVLHVSPNTAVLWFTFGACLLTVVLAGVYPAWNAARTDPARGLQASSLAGRHELMRRTLILVQVALAVVLLFGASLFSHSLRNLKVIDLGYSIDHVLNVDIGLRGTLKGDYGTVAPPEMREVLERVRHLPGVESAALSVWGILSGGNAASSFKLTDAGSGGAAAEPANVVVTSPDFFGTMHLRLLRGRDFSKADGPGAPPVAIVNQRLASMAWPGQSPIGKHMDGWNFKGIEVIGVIADSHNGDIRKKPDPTVYLAYDQQKTMGGGLELRCRGAMPPIGSAVRLIVKSVAPNYEVSRASSMELMRDNQISQERLLAFLSSLFGALDTTLALVGIYGLIAYSVMRRTREIGIRVSVGAQGRDVVWLFLREASLLLTAGVAVGLPLALLLARFVGKLLYQVPAIDPASAAVTVALIALGGAAASLIPARRAARVDPLTALRAE
jgi:predicted permease